MNLEGFESLKMEKINRGINGNYKKPIKDLEKQKTCYPLGPYNNPIIHKSHENFLKVNIGKWEEWFMIDFICL